MKERILWATRIGEPDWKEELITDTQDLIEPAMKWAKENGFDRIRISVFDTEEKPDPLMFVKAINL